MLVRGGGRFDAVGGVDADRDRGRVDAELVEHRQQERCPGLAIAAAVGCAAGRPAAVCSDAATSELADPASGLSHAVLVTKLAH